MTNHFLYGFFRTLLFFGLVSLAGGTVIAIKISVLCPTLFTLHYVMCGPYVHYAKKLGIGTC